MSSLAWQVQAAAGQLQAQAQVQAAAQDRNVGRAADRPVQAGGGAAGGLAQDRQAGGGAAAG